MIKRQLYIDKLKNFKDLQLIKILSGIRRCGKSTILEMFSEELSKTGVPQEHIIRRNYSDPNENYNMTYKDMFDDIRGEIKDGERHYLLLDEIQEIDGWERTINGLLENTNTDIYVTGSNSKLLSGEISSYLSGRYISIPVFPLSFSEFREFTPSYNTDISDQIDDYIRTGGFPLVALSGLDAASKYQIVDGIYNSVVSSDITRRNKIGNIELFNRVVRFIVENVGKTFSANSIAKFLKNEGRSLSVETIYNYIEWLEKAFIIYRCNRFDMQGKSILKTQEKFYLADHSLKYSIMGFNPSSVASTLENIVYLELKRHEYNVYIGKNGNKEIDFVAQKDEIKIYIQVCRSLPEESNREIDNLKEIADNHRKYILTLDKHSVGYIEGIEIVYLPDFLLESNKYL